MTYSTTFAAGTLMREDAARIVASLEGGDLEAIDSDVLDVPSRPGRSRRAREIVRRLEGVPESVWGDLPERSAEEQQAILYYCCMKTYRPIRDFHLDVVVPTWRSLDPALRLHDIRRYFEDRASQHPEIDDWSEGTWSKVQQVLRKMLEEAGLLRDGRLQPVRLPLPFWQRFVRVGDVWFLEAMLLNEAERQSVLQQRTS